MKNAILKVLNIKEGEEKPIYFLLTYSFFMGAAIAFFFTSTTSMFVINFDSGFLPYAYIGGGIMSYLIWFLYSKVAKRVNFRTLLFIGISILLISVAFFTIGVNFFNHKWLTFLMFVWIRVLVFISVVGFWSLATKMFDIRQGKRLFGLISSGEVISDMIGFFSIPLLLNYISTPQLLFLSFFFLVVCFGLMIIMVKRFKTTLHLDSIPETNKTSNFSQIKKNKYYSLLIGMAVLPMFGMCFVDYSFLSQTRIEFDNQVVLASFLSLFFGVTAVIEFIVKSFLSGRLLYKYGLKVSLIVVPILLAFSVFLVITSGVLYGMTGLFFSFIAFTKLIDRVLRSAIYDPSFQVLYQPLPEKDRVTVQAVIEGMAKGLGFAIAGVFVLVFAKVSSINLIYVNIIFILFLLIWVRISYLMYGQYRLSLNGILLENQENDILPIEDKANLFVLCKTFENNKNTNVNLAFNILQNIEPRYIPSFLQRLLVVSSIDNQDKILYKIIEYKVLTAQSILKKILQTISTDNSNKFIKAQDALLAFQKIDFATLEKYSFSDNIEERLLAANLLAYSGRHRTTDLLVELMHDTDCRVKKAAIISAGRFKREKLWPSLLLNLHEKDFARPAMSAIKMIGEPMLVILDEYFDKQTTPKHVKYKIIEIYLSIKGTKSLNYLRSRIQYPDEDIRHRIYKVLSKKQYRATTSETAFIKEAIFDELSTIVWLMASEYDIRKRSDLQLLKEALVQEQEKKKENLFLLLSMLYDSKTIQFIRESFETGKTETRMYAAEVLDITVSSEIKKLFLPFIDDVSLEERLQIFSQQFPQQKMLVHDRLINIINKSYSKINSWTKVCAIKGIENIDSNENILLANINNPNPIIQQLSIFLLKSHNSKRYNYLCQKQAISETTYIKSNEILLSEKVELLKKNNLFSHVTYANVAYMIEQSEEIQLHGENNTYKIQDKLFFILQGEVELTINGNYKQNLTQNNLYWGIVNDEEDTVILHAQNNSNILILNTDILFDIMTEKSTFTEEIMETINKIA